MGDHLISVTSPLLTDQTHNNKQENHDSLDLRDILIKGDDQSLRAYLSAKKETLSIAELNKALKESIQLGKISLVKVLLENHADPNGVEEFKPMLEFSIFYQRPDIFVALWEAGAEVVYEEEWVPRLLEIMEDFHKLTNWLMRFDAVTLTSTQSQSRPAVSSFHGNMLQIWQQIIQNDDVEQLARFYDSGKWREKTKSSSSLSMSFEVSQNFPTNEFIMLFQKYHDNGLGILTAVKEKLSDDKETKDLQLLFKEISGLKWLRKVSSIEENSVIIEDVTIFPSFENSFLLLAILGGRLEIVEILIRMRQFDILPAALMACLFTRRLQNFSHLPDQARARLEEFADNTEGIARDALTRMSLLDNKVVLSMLQTPLKTCGNLTLIDLADKANCSTLLSLACCQTVLREQWKGINTTHMKTVSSQDKLLSQLRSPRSKFISHSTMHVIFLMSLSFILLRNFNSSPTPLEYICMAYVVSYLIETMRLFFLPVRDEKGGGILFVIRQPRYWLDVCATLFTLGGFIWRWNFSPRFWKKTEVSPEDTEAFYLCRVLLLSGLLLFYFRLLPILSINHVLGPRLTMMKDMLLKDLLPLASVFLIFLVAFGVVIQSLLYPNGKGRKDSPALPHSDLFYLFRRSFYGMFAAEYPLEELECEENKTCPNPLGSDLVLFAFHAAFVFAVNISLINLLIALFSNTVANIAAKSRAHWLAKRYDLVAEYQRHSLLPPPFNCIMCVIDAIQSCLQRSSSSKNSSTSTSKHEEENENIWKRYLIVQAFAVRNQRHQLGEVKSDLQMKRIEMEVSELRRELQVLLQSKGKSQSN